MTLDRRRFLALSAAAAGGIGLTGFAAEKKLRILVLGGTKFLGPAIVDTALARGHEVTLFNRGRTNPQLYPTVEKLLGDRDPKKGEGLKALEGKRWDAVIDDSGYYPRMVRASAQLLAPASGQYIYISSISCYKDNATENADESYPVATMADPTLETMGKEFEYYGALKALCEQETRTAFGDRATVVRPGYIVGPNDPTDRFTWWIVRAAKGGEMLAPGAPKDPIQVIDVRDLGAWLVTLAERRTAGTFNGCGPAKKLAFGEMLDQCLAATGRKAQPTWVDSAFLRTKGENGEGSIPIWAPYDGNTKCYHTWSNARAIKAGLTFRPLPETVRDTLAWFRTLPAERQADMKAGIKPADETAWLAEWHKARS